MSAETTNGNEKFNPFGDGLQRSIARRAGLDPASTHRILTGKSGVTLATAARIARAARVSIDELHAHIEKERARRALEHATR